MLFLGVFVDEDLNTGLVEVFEQLDLGITDLQSVLGIDPEQEERDGTTKEQADADVLRYGLELAHASAPPVGATTTSTSGAGETMPPALSSMMAASIFASSIALFAFSTIF